MTDPPCLESVDLENLVIQEPKSIPGPPPPVYSHSSTVNTTVTPRSMLSNHPEMQPQIIRELCAGTVTDSTTTSDMSGDAVRSYSIGNSNDVGFLNVGLGHRGIDHKMKQFPIVSLQLSSMFEANSGCLKHLGGFYIPSSLQESVPNEPSVWACIIFMDQHSGQLNAIEYWRNKWKFKLISEGVKCVMIS